MSWTPEDGRLQTDHHPASRVTTEARRSQRKMARRRESGWPRPGERRGEKAGELEKERVQKKVDHGKPTTCTRLFDAFAKTFGGLYVRWLAGCGPKHA